MSARTKLLIAVLFLVFLGGGLAWHKVVHLGIPFWRGESVQDWEIEAKVSFLGTGKRPKARLSLPAVAVDMNRGQEAGSLGYSFYTERNEGEYTAVWSGEERQGGQALYFRIRVPEGTSGGGEPIPGNPPEAVTPGFPSSLGDPARAVVGRIKTTTSDPDSLFVSVFQQISGEDAPQEILLLKRHYEKESREMAVLDMGIDLLNLAGVPARLAYGVRLEPDLGAQPPVPLLEYYDGAYWKVRNPMEPGQVLDGTGLYVWHRGGGPLLDVTGGENSRVVFTVAKEPVPLRTLTDLRDSPWMVSTILGLPLSERAVFRYIVLIPLGAFVVVLLRNIVGIPTLGTFMPVLIALALLEIPLARGLIMFSVLIGAGLWFRFLLSRLNLLVVPRVAACVVIVTLLMMLMSVIGYRMGMAGGVQITLFPMIILAWTIERMSLIWEEEGKRSAIIQVGGSLLVAVFAFFFMRIGQVQYWSFYFPELLLVLLAGILMIGRYTGYRLSELIRFKTFSDA
ncbi:MAG: UUP1 family membrane protein [Verrucomicrobiae bacterium]|nr:UUP1 family membrane protein [Verrucomicrobiae bacterium]MCP5533777.1 UUP1 family membrane protein [Akkermansiaceae bacterium]MCP5544664.1 UUP1 family membrane protein [Akkermansiaceae bacterium]MCP5548517.1 UUP1 family membrane protein [Akkermansiaceae bacterium]